MSRAPAAVAEPLAAAGRKAGPRASIVVPTYDRRDSVLRLLGALREQTAPTGDFEVIVVIDGSEDGTREAIAGFSAPFRTTVVWQPNEGRAAACNEGIRRARGELLIILDDDMAPASDFVAAHLRAHARGERIGVLGAVPIHADRTSPPVVRYVAAKFNEHLERLAGGAEIRFRSFYSGNFSIRRTLLEEVGPYDESFRIYGNEDTELSLRLLDAGIELRYDADALAQQHYEKDFGGLARDNLAKGRTAVLAATKHPGAFGPFSIDAFRTQTGKWDRSPRWMRIRDALVSLTRQLPFLPRLVVSFVKMAERLGAPRLRTIYGFAIDYHFWLGVAEALEEEGLGTVAAPAGEPSGAAGGTR
jgi:GT2 family glycosyltransferase